MPFPFDGRPTGFEQYFEEQLENREIAEIGDFSKILMLEPAREAFHELQARPELRDDVTRAKELSAKLGY